MVSINNAYVQKVKNALNAKFVQKSDIVDDLTHTDTNKPLSAKQGKVLNDTLGDVANVLSTVITFINQ